LISGEEWEKWLRKLAAAPPPLTGAAAFSTRAGLARHHNLQAFLYSLYVNARESADPNMQVLVPALQKVLKDLP